MKFLILVRHGQSTWNLEKRFTGWVDVDLTDQGKLDYELGACFYHFTSKIHILGKAVNKSAASAASLDGFSSRDQVGC